MRTSVPEHDDAVPADAEADVGRDVYPEPGAVIMIGVPLATVFVPESVRVPVAPVPPPL